MTLRGLIRGKAAILEPTPRMKTKGVDPCEVRVLDISMNRAGIILAVCEDCMILNEQHNPSHETIWVAEYRVRF